VTRSLTQLVFVSVFVANCGSQNQPSAQQTAEVQQGADGMNTMTQTIALADSLFRFDPDLDPSGSLNANLQVIQNNVMRSDGGCATATASGSTGLTIVFAPNCTLQGVSISGTVNLQLSSPAARTLTVAVTLTSVVVNGWDLAGTVDFSTSDGAYLSVNLNVTHAGTSYEFDGTVSGAPGVITIDGSLTIGGNSGTVTSVMLQHGACWPESGTVLMTLSGLAATLTFEPSTATSGQASVTYQTPAGTTKPACYELSSHGTCTPTPCSG
jgi:hypothetical protein